MAIKTVPFDLQSFDAAPLQVKASAKIAAAPSVVFSMLADPSTWPDWFWLMRETRWTSSEIACVGAERHVRLLLLGKFDERIIAWEPGRRFAFTMLTTDLPLATSIGEDYRLQPLEDGRATQLHWTLAATPRALGKLVRPLLVPTLKHMIARSGDGLSAFIDKRAAGSVSKSA